MNAYGTPHMLDAKNTVVTKAGWSLPSWSLQDSNVPEVAKSERNTLDASFPASKLIIPFLLYILVSDWVYDYSSALLC